MLLYSVLNLPKVLLVVATVGTSYLINLDPFMPLLMLLVLDSIYHDVQYQGWMAHYQKKFFPNVKNVAGKWLAASIVYGIIAGVLEYYSFSGGFFAYLFVPFSMLVAYHYYVDGLIWKFRKDHRLRKTLLD
ncbi:hypothetical protein CMO91_03270 [Candidatus Woesearchaeota archaeon]|nr:hypothetical protein [Candidatus Woesearchaeota archaeon]